MAKVKVTVYARAGFSGECEVISKEDFSVLIDQVAEVLRNDEIELESWLEDTFSHLELWNMSAEDKAVAKEKFNALCRDWALDDIMEEWEEHILETEVECQCSKE